MLTFNLMTTHHIRSALTFEPILSSCPTFLPLSRKLLYSPSPNVNLSPTPGRRRKQQEGTIITTTYYHHHHHHYVEQSSDFGRHLPDGPDLDLALVLELDLKLYLKIDFHYYHHKASPQQQQCESPSGYVSAVSAAVVRR